MSEAWTYEHAYPIPTSPERLFAVLTEREDLERWFAEHVRIDRRPGGKPAIGRLHSTRRRATGLVVCLIHVMRRKQTRNMPTLGRNDA